MISLEAIRALYPHPIADTPGHVRPGDAYCVGGALCKFVDPRWQLGFPAEDELAETLQETNPALDLAKACAYAETIIHHNDSGHFQAAWHVLGEALKYEDDRRAEAAYDAQQAEEAQSWPVQDIDWGDTDDFPF